MLLTVCVVNGVCSLVAGAVEAHDQAVADQLVVAHALHAGQIANAIRVGAQAEAERQAQAKQ